MDKVELARNSLGAEKRLIKSRFVFRLTMGILLHFRAVSRSQNARIDRKCRARLRHLVDPKHFSMIGVVFTPLLKMIGVVFSLHFFTSSLLLGEIELITRKRFAAPKRLFAARMRFLLIIKNICCSKKVFGSKKHCLIANTRYICEQRIAFADRFFLKFILHERFYTEPVLV